MLRWAVLRRWVDPVLAVLLLAVGLVALLGLPPGESGFVAPRWLDAAFLLLTCIPLAWRQRAPLPAFAVVLVAAWTWLLLWYTDQPQPPFEPAVALWLVTFSAAAAARGHTRWAVGVALAAFLLTTDLPAMQQGRPLGNVLPAWVLFALSFAVGRAVGRRQEQAAALTERALVAEAGRQQQAQRAVAAERSRIARELHDVISHAVSVMVVQAAAEARALDPGGSSTRQVLQDIETTGRDALVELRRMLGVLRRPDEPEDRHPQPGVTDLAALVEGARGAGLAIQMHVAGQPRPLPASIDLTAFRVVQEALTNVAKHAGPVRVTIDLSYGPDALHIEVVNEPATTQPPEHLPGYGLLGLQERVSLHNGRLQQENMSDGGFRLAVTLPYEGYGTP